MNDKIKNLVNTLLFSALLLGVLVVNILSPDKELSFSERRKLRQFPVLSWANVVNTKAMEDFDKYVLDQFVGRDDFRKLKSITEFSLLLKKDNNDLFVKDGYIFKNLYPLNCEAVEYAASRFNYLYDKYLQGKKVYFSVIPDKNYYLDESLGYLRFDYDGLVDIMKTKLERMQYIAIFDTLQLEGFYRTDIHWRQELLGETVKKLADSMDFKVGGDYQLQVFYDFKGAYHGQLALRHSPEKLIFLTSELLDNLQVHDFETSSYAPIYDMSKSNNLDLYDIFLSGPKAILIIENPEATSEKELIVFRDSFGSSIIPLMLSDYKKVTIIDIRYVSCDFLAQAVDFSADDVLFLYSVNILNSGTVLR